MPFRTLLLLECLLLAAGTACTQVTAQETPEPALLREFRGAWVVTVNNGDWPSRPGLPVPTLRAELDAIVQRSVELKLNALVFQVRPCADAFYASRLEPWSEWLTGVQGQAPAEDFDPLAYVITRCHEHGLQLHAWLNPFRARHERSKSPPAKSHVSQQVPQIVVRYGDYEWMDPGEPLAMRWSLAVVQDIVQRYDVDGMHIDDYFYPYPKDKLPFPDDASFQRYRAGGGQLARSDWRRSNIDEFVRRMYEIVHQARPWVQVGISPFGIARPGVPAGIKAGIDQYAQLYADVPKWLREGWLDYLTPQLYWPIDQQAQSFAALLPWWHAQNVQKRHLWPGINPGRMLEQKSPWRSKELADQISLIRAAGGTTPGHVHFSFRALRTDAAHVGGDLRDRIYREVVLAPAVPWLGEVPPRAPVARLESSAGRRTVRWTPDPDTRFVVVQVRTANGWSTHAIVGAATGRCALPVEALSVAVTAVSRTGIASTAATLR